MDSADSSHTEASSARTKSAGAPSILAEIREQTGLDPARCYQCGKCSAGCPMAEEMDLVTHEMIRLLQLDRRERLLRSESPWLCLTCETCTTRCPNSFDPARVIDGLREIALHEAPAHIPRRIRAFHHCFLRQIRTHGRVFELGLVASFKLRSGALFNDVGSFPGMLRRGKLALKPKRIAGIADVRRIFDACRRTEEVEP
jgi:heterodisulfide reductase subunit C